MLPQAHGDGATLGWSWMELHIARRRHLSVAPPADRMSSSSSPTRCARPRCAGLDDRLGSSEVCCSTPWPPCRQRFVSGLLRRVWVWGAVITAPCGAFHSWIGAFTTALARPSHCPSLSSSWPSGCEKRPTSRSQCCETNVNAPSTPQRTTASAARRDVHVLPHFRRRRYKRAATTLELLGSDVLAVVGAPSYMSTMR